MTTKLAIVLLSSAFAVSHAAPVKKGSTASPVITLTPAPLSGAGPSLLKKVKAANPGRVAFFDQDGGWTVYYAIALAAPLTSPEIDLKISDVSRTKQAVGSRHKMIYTDASVIRGSFTLTRDEVLSPNAKLLVEIESDGVPVVQRAFFIQSKTAAAAKNKIEFSADEAAGDDADDGPIVAKRH